MSDVVIATSKSESFGSTILESQLCGTPVISNNVLSIKDKTYKGICVEPDRVSYKIGNLNSWSETDPKNIYDALVDIYQNNQNKVKNDTISSKNYDINHNFNDWCEFLDI